MKPVVFVTYTQTIQQKVPHTLLPFPSLFLILLGLDNMSATNGRLEENHLCLKLCCINKIHRGCFQPLSRCWLLGFIFKWFN